MVWNLNLNSVFALSIIGICFICLAEDPSKGKIGSFEITEGGKLLKDVLNDKKIGNCDGLKEGFERIQGLNEDFVGFCEDFGNSGEFNRGLFGKSGEEIFGFGKSGYLGMASREFFDCDEDELEVLGRDFISTPIRENSGRYLFDPFARLFPQIFVSAQETSSSISPNPFDLSQSSFHSIFLVLFSIIELVLSSSHILVHLGIKNPRYRFIIKQRVYFLIDGATTTTNLIYFWDSYYYLKPFLLYAIFAHIYYVADLFVFSGKSRIFEWSSVDKGLNRFDFIYLRENFETLVDDSCHLFGFITAFSLLSSTFQLVSIVSSFTLLYVLVLNAKFFFSKRHMMPSWLHILAEDSR